MILKLKLKEPKYQHIDLHLYILKTIAQQKLKRRLKLLLKEKGQIFYTYQTYPKIIDKIINLYICCKINYFLTND